jgi:flavin-binding protein dodecin
MAVVKIIELVGSSPKSWEEAVQNAVKEASRSIRGITRVGVKEMDVKVDGAKVTEYRARVEISFRIER